MSKKIGNDLRKVRIDLNLNLEEMAQRIGFSTAYVSCIETGVRPVLPDFINALTNYLTVHISEISKSLDQETYREVKQRIKSIETRAFETNKDVKIRTTCRDKKRVAYDFARYINYLPDEQVEFIGTYIKQQKAIATAQKMEYLQLEFKEQIQAA